MSTTDVSVDSSGANTLMDGVDLASQASTGTVGSSWHAKISPNAYAWVLIIGALAALWLLGGMFFKSANH